MKEFTIQKNDAGQRLDRFVGKAVPLLPESLLQKYIEGRDMDMIVTSTDIDAIIKDFSDIISNAINITLHPGIYS